MIKRLSILNGLAILAVVINHAAGFGQMGMFLWAHRYRPVESPNWDQIGSFSYYLLLVLRQGAVFCVPAFLFVSGFFIAYATRTHQGKLSWKIVWSRILALFIPYLVWSALVFLFDLLQGVTYPPLKYVELLFTSGAEGPYWFLPLLCYLYLLSPLIVLLAKKSWQAALLVSGVFQTMAMGIKYAVIFGVRLPAQSFLDLITQTWFITHWVFFFTLGIVVGLNLPAFKGWLARFKRIWLAVVVAALLLNIAEADLLLRTTHAFWGAYQGTFTFNLFALSFLFCFLAYEDFKIPYLAQVSQLGAKSFGIYLVHYSAMEILARLIYHYVPALLGVPWLFSAVLFAFGLAIPLGLIALVTHTPARKAYRYLFA